MEGENEIPEKVTNPEWENRPLDRNDITEGMVTTRIRVLEQGKERRGNLPPDEQAELDALKETRYPRIAVLEAEKAINEITAEGKDELERLRKRFKLEKE